MEIHQLRYFLAVAKTGGFTAAAKECHVSQPSLSIQVSKLEDELGARLFQRLRKGNRLTAQGQAFLKHAQAALVELEQGKRELVELGGLQQGQVSFGCLPSTGTHVLPPLLKAFKQAHPQLQVLLREESSPGLVRCLENGEVDLAIVDDAGLAPSLACEKLFSEELWLAVPRQHRLAHKGRASLREVSQEPFILMKQGHGFRQISLAAFERAGVQPKVVFESGEIETVQALVAAGLGLSLVPSMVKKEAGPAYLQLPNPRPARSLYLAKRKGMVLAPAGEALRQTAIKILVQGPKFKVQG